MEAVSPVVRAIGVLRAWAEQSQVHAVLLAIYEWATVDSRLQAHRERWEQKGIPISVTEAENALSCLGYAAFNEPVEPAQYLVDKLEPGFPFWPWHGESIHPRCPEYHVFSR